MIPKIFLPNPLPGQAPHKKIPLPQPLAPKPSLRPRPTPRKRPRKTIRGELTAEKHGPGHPHPPRDLKKRVMREPEPAGSVRLDHHKSHVQGAGKYDPTFRNCGVRRIRAGGGDSRWSINGPWDHKKSFWRGRPPKGGGSEDQAPGKGTMGAALVGISIPPTRGGGCGYRAVICNLKSCIVMVGSIN
jgi:hypothetical protein